MSTGFTDEFFAMKRKEFAKFKGNEYLKGKEMHPMTTYGNLLYDFCYYSRWLKEILDNYIIQLTRFSLK